MALNSGDVFSATDFINLKARVKAECARRKYNGSVASYATATYDYTVVPSANTVPLPEHFNKIITPMNAMVNTGRSTVSSGSLVAQLASISSALSTLEAKDVTASNSGCKSSCTGLCQGTCTGTCTSGCSSGCKGSCKGSCSGSCASQCIDTCKDVCASDCTATCGLGCSFGCVDTCSGTCTDGCMGACKGWCKGNVNADPS